MSSHNSYKPENIGESTYEHYINVTTINSDLLFVYSIPLSSMILFQS